MSPRRIVGLLGAATVAWGALLPMSAPSASAQQCPDLDVVFARGTAELPGVGGTGQAFVDALRAQAGQKTVDAYPVDYPASSDFGNRIQFAQTVIDGINNAGAHVQATAANCPNTRIVMGGYSQGAAVAGYLTSAEIPPGIPAEYLQVMPQPMPKDVAKHVDAVVLFGKPSDAFISDVGAPPIVIGPAYAAKTLQLCIPDDTICNGAPPGPPNMAHTLYGVNGMANDAAAYVMSHL